jgi:hypothetical protein
LTDDTFCGIPKHGITEISGEAGSGKTQICISLAIQVSSSPLFFWLFTIFLLFRQLFVDHLAPLTLTLRFYHVEKVSFQ